MTLRATRHVPRRRDILLGSLTGAALASSRAMAFTPAAGEARNVRVSAPRALRVLIPEGSQANLKPVAAAFRAAHGVDITLEVCGVDDVATEMTLRSLAGDTGFDVALPATFSIPDLVEAGVIQPFPASLRENSPGKDGSLYPLGDRYKGTTYGLQTDGDVYLMFYNRGLLADTKQRARFEDRFGRELTVPTTWEELDAALEFFHDPENGRFGGALFRSPGYIAWEFWIRLHAKGLFPVDEQMRPLLSSPEGLAAASELIAASKWLCPGADTANLFDNWETFSKGQTFCNIGWGGSQKYFRRPASAIREQVVPAATPGGRIGDELVPISYFNWGWNFTIASDSPAPELAADFARFATTGEAAMEAVRAADGFFDPFRPEHYGDALIQETYTKEFLEQHRSALEGALPDFYLQGRGEYFDLLGRFLGRANAGKMKVEDALEVVSQGWELITDRIGRDSQIAQWQFLKGRYPASLRSQLRSTADTPK